jgi:hypothetical protein
MSRLYVTGFALLLLIFTAACLGNQARSSKASDAVIDMAPTAPPIPEAAHPAFAVTAEEVRTAFDVEELRGEKKQGIGVGEEKSINITAKDRMGKLENLKFSIMFLTPLGQADAAGYAFGLVARDRTPADRKEFEDRVIARIAAHSNEVAFRVFLQQPTNEDAAIPSISFKLMNANGNRVLPLSQPNSYVSQGRDIIDAVALAENGQPVTFPLFAGPSPNLTAKMKRMTLIIEVDEKETSLEFALK